MIGEVLKNHPYYLKVGADPLLDGLALIRETANRTQIFIQPLNKLFNTISECFLENAEYMTRLDMSENNQILILDHNVFNSELIHKLNSIDNSNIRSDLHYAFDLGRSESILTSIEEAITNISEYKITGMFINMLKRLHALLVIETFKILAPLPHIDMNVESTIGRKLRMNTQSYYDIVSIVMRNKEVVGSLEDHLIGYMNRKLNMDVYTELFNRDLSDPIFSNIVEDSFDTNIFETMRNYIFDIIRSHTDSGQSNINTNIISVVSSSITRQYLMYSILVNIERFNMLAEELNSIVKNNEDNFSIEMFRNNFNYVKDKLTDMYITLVSSLSPLISGIYKQLKEFNVRNRLIIGENESSRIIDYINNVTNNIKEITRELSMNSSTITFINILEKEILRSIPKPDTDLIFREKETSLLNSYINKVWINNVILIGEPGVGKTHIIENINQTENSIKIFMTDNAIKFFTDIYKSKSNILELFDTFIDLIANVLEIDIEEIGSIDNISKIEYVFKAYEKITNVKPILFIDEIHHILRHKEIGDILKSLLTRKNIRIIGATTYREYEKYIASDLAIVRRFEKLYINPFNKEQTIYVLKNEVRTILEENYNGIKIDDDHIEKLYDVIHKYYRLSPLKDPGLSISIMDGLFSYIYNNTELQENEEYYINEDDIKRYLATICNINIDEIIISSDRDDILRKIEEVENIIRGNIKGQETAVNTVIRQIKKYLFGLHNDNKPIGVFLFLGPTGVGKTELAKMVAKSLFGDENNMIRLDMSEFKQSHSIEKLWGSPPGYVGYGESGILNSEISKKPNSVILLDEIEKAHPRVLDAFLQIFDDGRMRDGQGREYDFSNTFIIMTSNMFSDKITNMDYKEAKKYVMSNITKYLRPEFINRIDNIVIFNSLDEKVIYQIIDKFIMNMVDNFAKKGYKIHVNNQLHDYIVRNKYNKVMGARSIKRYIENTLTNAIVEFIIDNNRIGGDVYVTIDNNKVVIK